MHKKLHKKLRLIVISAKKIEKKNTMTSLLFIDLDSPRFQIEIEKKKKLTVYIKS